MSKKLIITPRQIGKTTYLIKLFLENPNENLLLFRNKEFKDFVKERFLLKQKKNIYSIGEISSKLRGFKNKWDSVLIDEFLFCNINNLFHYYNQNNNFWNNLICISSLPEDIKFSELLPVCTFLNSPNNKNKDLNDYDFIYNKKTFQFRNHLSFFSVDEIEYKENL